MLWKGSRDFLEYDLLEKLLDRWKIYFREKKLRIKWVMNGRQRLERSCLSFCKETRQFYVLFNFCHTVWLVYLYLTDLSLYKLVQYLKKYINSNKNETFITICLCTAWKWLYKLGFEYKNVKKDIFVNRHKCSDVVKDCQNFLKKIEKLQPYLVEFEADKTIKPEEYLLDCIVGGSQHQLVIVITHDKCTFSANDGKQKAWARKK